MKFETFLKIFLIILLTECFANAFGILPLQFVSKPSLMLALIYYFRDQSSDLPALKHLITAALFFSWLGDVLLLIDKGLYSFFIYGLMSFLLAHILYIIYFWQIAKFNLTKIKLKPAIILIVLFYASVFYLLISPFLSDLQIPVLFYCLIISAMLIASFHAFDLEKQKFGKICVTGTLLFALSDSLLAVNRFVMPLPLGSVLIISTYSIGQLLIAEGALRNLREIELK